MRVLGQGRGKRFKNSFLGQLRLYEHWICNSWSPVFKITENKVFSVFSDINQVGEVWSPGNVDFAYFPACPTQKLIQKLIHGPGGSLGALRTA